MHGYLTEVEGSNEQISSERMHGIATDHQLAQG